MTDILNIPGLALATFILGISPGPAVFATLSVALSHSRQAVILFITGILMGDILFASLAMIGLGTIADHIPTLLLLIRIMGGFYLIYLGIRAWPQKQMLESVNDNMPVQTIPLASPHMFLAGFILTASNPKDLLFFVTFLPAFIDLKSATLPDMMMAAALIVITFIGTLSVYAGLGSVTGVWLRTPKTVLWLDRVAGGILILAGLMVLFSGVYSRFS